MDEATTGDPTERANGTNSFANDNDEAEELNDMAERRRRRRRSGEIPVATPVGSERAAILNLLWRTPIASPVLTPPQENPDPMNSSIIVPSTESGNNKEYACWRSPCRIGTAAAIIIFAIGAAIFAVLILNDKDSNSSEDDDNSFPTIPTVSPTSFPEEGVGLFGDIRKILLSHNVVVPSSLLDGESSPQYNALSWLENTDFHLPHPIPSSPEDHEVVIQRFVAVAFSFSLGGGTNASTWTQVLGFLDPTKSECEWKRVNAMGDLEGITECDDNARITRIQIDSPLGLSGTIPNEIGFLTQLNYISLSNNIGIHGTIPLSIGRWTQITTIRIFSNSLVGSIPADIGDLAWLTDLSLLQNELTGSIPPSIGNLTNLKVLAFQDNHLTGILPSTLGNLELLQRLLLENNLLSGAVPSTVSNMKSLKTIWLSGNDITGGLDSFCGISFLGFFADCLEEVNCSCCTECCRDDVGCVPNVNF